MDVFDLVAKIRLDSSEYESGLGKAKGSFSSLASGVGKGLLTVAKVGGAAVSAGVAGVAALTKMGVEGYAQYEQLAGGAKLLWGDAYDFVAEKAAGAYATVQMSQNDYLRQINAFSTGLKTSLGGNAEAAAVLANDIITAQADIVAATGASRESVENAFNGIMKSNFSMLDNLQLGITPTKEGFQEVIDKVNEWNAANGEATNYQISNLADCQSALLDYIEMQGMSGYAADEAAKTIEGSLAMMKGAWENLVVGMSDSNADIGQLIDNFVESAGVAAENLIPRIEQTLLGIGELIEKLAPIISEALPKVIESVLPSLITAGMQLITAIVNGLITAAPAIYQALLDAVFIALTSVFGMSEEEANKFVSVLDTIVRGAVDVFKMCFNGIVEFVKITVNNISTMVTGIGEFVGLMIDAGKKLLTGLKDGAYTIFVEILGAVGGWVTDNIVNPIADMGTALYNAGRDILNEFWDGMKSIWDGIKRWWDGLTFSQKTAPVATGGYPHATGLNYVPFDGYPAILHRGEAVLTSAEARLWRNGGFGATPAMAGVVVVNQYIQSVPQTPVEFANATEAYFEQARWAL